MKKKLFLLCVLLPAIFCCAAQEDWKLKSDKDGIKAYSRKTEDSKINSIRVEADFSVSLAHFVSAIIDVASYDDWVYASKSTRMIKQVSPTELYYYSEIKFPWPTANRDFVSHVTVSQDPKTKTVTISAINVAGMEPLKKNLIRIDHSFGKWVVKPAGKESVNVVYELQTDPAGSLPALLINSFSSTGIVATFQNLRARLAKNIQAVNNASFIKE